MIGDKTKVFIELGEALGLPDFHLYAVAFLMERVGSFQESVPEGDGGGCEWADAAGVHCNPQDEGINRQKRKKTESSRASTLVSLACQPAIGEFPGSHRSRTDKKGFPHMVPAGSGIP